METQQMLPRCLLCSPMLMAPNVTDLTVRRYTSPVLLTKNLKKIVDILHKATFNLDARRSR